MYKKQVARIQHQRVNMVTTLALHLAATCLRDNRILGRGVFRVSSNYRSFNLSPDLYFSTLGIALNGTQDDVDMIMQQMDVTKDSVTILTNFTEDEYNQVVEKLDRPPVISTPEWAKITKISMASDGFVLQRVMGQILWPLCIEALYFRTGDIDYLRKLMPYIDLSLSFIEERVDENGIFSPKNTHWQGAPGMEWVDWDKSRLSGSSFMFQIFHVLALERMGALHMALFQTGSPFSYSKGEKYAERSNSLRAYIEKMYWNEEGYYNTNHNFASTDTELWYDNQIWALYLNMGSPDQKHKLMHRLQNDQKHVRCHTLTGFASCEPETVPTRWNARSRCSRDARTWLGRLGCGGAVARYDQGDYERASELMRRMADVVTKNNGFYEAYDMAGNPTDDRGELYLEHCGGYIWAFFEGVWGIRLHSASSTHDVTIVNPAERSKHLFPGSRSIKFHVKGCQVMMSIAEDSAVSFEGDGPCVNIKLVENKIEKTIITGQCDDS